MKLTDIGEFGLIRRFSPPFLSGLPSKYIGIGDDCAVIPWMTDRVLLVTTDMLIESTHFLMNRISPRDLGHKSLIVNLSDIAAMGGIPTSVFLSIGIPAETEIEWLDRFFAGLNESARENGVHLLGGDTTRSPKHLMSNMVVLGEAEPAKVKYRADAGDGDIICVTGYLGDSGAGLRLILEDRMIGDDGEYLITQHHRPRAHLAEGAWLASRSEVHAMMDVSDGIDSDLHRIMEASKCGARVDLENLPMSEVMIRTAENLGWDPREIAATGGEDYCLLATVDTRAYVKLAADFKQKFGRDLFRIGTVRFDSDELNYFDNNKPVKLGRHGFNHFQEQEQ